MSFVSVFGMKDFVTVMSDGLAVDIKTGEVKDHKFQKFKKISPKQFVAVTGNKGVGEKIFDDMGYEDSERSLEKIARELRETLIKELPYDLAKMQIAIGGVENDRIIIYSFDNNENKDLKILEPVGIDPVYTCMASSQCEIDFDQEMNHLYNAFRVKSATSALKLQETLNTKVASTDPTVNKFIFKLTIKL
ncbi:hypothetical protein R0K05_03100 [Planococcus sp. SIMBA_160]